MDSDWIDFAVGIWRTETRPDASTKASIRNPHNHSDKVLYRIHYLEMRIGDMQNLIVTRGKEKYGDKFHFSWWYCIKESRCAPFGSRMRAARPASVSTICVSTSWSRLSLRLHKEAT